MKCPNCGFECHEKYCAMCGTRIPEQPVQSNNISYSGVASTFGGAVPPVQTPYNPPVQNMNPPIPPQYAVQPEKKSKVLPIFLISLISAVILAGIIISIYSACTYNKNIIESIGSQYSSMSYDAYSDSSFEIEL